MMSVAIKEAITVGAIFRGSRIWPRWFIWKNRKYRIREVTYFWQSTSGEARIFHFACYDGANLYELSLNTREMSWRLENIEPEM